jgi:hypothetical protein
MSYKNMHTLKSRIALLEAELQGLRFACELMEAEAPAKRNATVSTSRYRETPSVRTLIMQVLEEHPEGLPYRAVANLAAKKVGRPVNPKTVSSSLDFLKKRGKVISANDLYKLPDGAGQPANLRPILVVPSA